MKDDAAILISILKRSSVAILVDAFIVLNAYVLAMMALIYVGASSGSLHELIMLMPAAVVAHCFVNYKFGLYRYVGNYVGLSQALAVIKSSAVAVTVLLIAYFILMSSFPRHTIVLIPIGGMMVLIFSCGVRFYPRIFYERSLRDVTSRTNVLVVGAGNAGERIIRNIQVDRDSTMNVIAVVDDDPMLKGLEIHGVPIKGCVNEIPSIVNEKHINEILIAIPSASVEQFQRIWKYGSMVDLPVKTLGSLQNTYYGEIGVRQIRDIQIEDVLGRRPVRTDYNQISQFIQGKTVAVTGAGGSIGSELVLQISQHGPSKIILIDQDETALYQIHERLKRRLFNKFDLFVADIKTERKMRSVFARTKPDIVFHAAAYKHVPLVEMHPDEGILNNVWGTLNIASISGEYGVQSFVNISTDKAVEPVNVLGATKRLSERLVAELNGHYPGTRYCSVRFGNVLGSRGSVLPIFRKQILTGGPVTVTDPRMTRYFMMVSEAVDLVLQSAAFRDRDAIYVLDMGEPVKIVDLAQQMIDFFKTEKPVEVVFTGLRPGEKLYEHLFEVNETPEASSHPMINRINPFHWGELMILDKLPQIFEKARDEDSEAIKVLLKDWIKTYKPFDRENIGQLADVTENYSIGSTDATIASSYDYMWSYDADNVQLEKSSEGFGHPGQ